MHAAGAGDRFALSTGSLEATACGAEERLPLVAGVAHQRFATTFFLVRNVYPSGLSPTYTSAFLISNNYLFLGLTRICRTVSSPARYYRAASDLLGVG